MDNNELIKEVHLQLKEMNLSNKATDTKEIFETIINTIFSNVSQGKTVVIRNFGTFHSTLEKRLNPMDLEAPAKESWVIKFSAAQKFRKAIKNK